MNAIQSLVSTEWLASQMKKPNWNENFRVIDATWDEPQYQRNLQQEHQEERIPGARYYDLNRVADDQHEVMSMRPRKEQFEDYVSERGISNKHHVIIYENNPRHGLFSAARVWWEFRVYGHDNVSVLDGGLPKWQAEGHPVASGDYSADEALPAAPRFLAILNPNLVVDFDFMKSNVRKVNPTQVVDTRLEQRFLGHMPEPIPHIASGHIPGSVSTQHPDFMTDGQGWKVLRSKQFFSEYLQKKGLDLTKEVVATCLVGMSASIASLMLFHYFQKQVPVYDGAWVEWQPNTPAELQHRE